MSAHEADVKVREISPECNLVARWNFVLGTRDSLLVLRALGGRLTTEEDLAAASALCDRLTLLRASSASAILGGLERAAEAVRAKEDKLP